MRYMRRGISFGGGFGNKRKTIFIVLLIIVIVSVFFGVTIPVLYNRATSVESIEIIQKPNKLVYVIGEKADYTGLRVMATRKNGKTFEVEFEDCEIVGFRSAVTEENCFIIVKYKGCSATFSVTINELDVPAPTIKSISLSPLPKTEYLEGEWLNTDGVYIIREYTDGSKVTVNLLKTDVYGWENVWGKGPGTYVLTVKYSENGITVETTYTITVSEAPNEE